MVDLLYVRRIRRKRIAAALSAATAGTLIALGIIAFLGRTVGTFSITLEKSDVSIALSADREFTEPTSYLRVPDLPAITLWTNRSIIDDGYSNIDNEANSWKTYGAKKDDEGKVIGLHYFQYTFFIKNMGVVRAAYDFTMTIADITNPKNPANHDLGDILRVRVFENDAYDESSHENRVFAKTTRQVNYDEDGNQTNQEYVAGDPSNKRNYDGFAEEFESVGKTGGIIMKSRVTDFRQNDIIRYTIVYWLEGEDPECQSVAPEGCSIKIGVNIKAYEN